MEHDHDHSHEEEVLDPEIVKEAQAYAKGSYDLPPPAPAPEAMKAVTAFLVVTKSDGSHVGIADVNTPLELERPATINDMYVGSAQVMRDVEIMQITQNVVQNVINAQMQMAQQAMAAQENVKLANQIMTPNRAQRRH